jgi:hypothetical protein
MVAMEVLVLLQSHGTQGRAHRPFSWGEDRAHQKHLDMLEDAFGEKWRKGCEYTYHLGW